MSTFKAESVVKPLRYSLKPFVDAEGVVPEPSYDAVQEFFELVQTAARKANIIQADAEINSAGDAAAAIEQISESIASGREISAELDEGLVKLCAGSPTREQLEEMPYRVRMKFSAWLMKELRPEA